MIYTDGAKLSGGLKFSIDELTKTRIAGWIQDTANPNTPVTVDIRAGGKIIASCTADQKRADLDSLSIGARAFKIAYELPSGAQTIRSIDICVGPKVIFSTGQWLGDLPMPISENDTMYGSSLYHYFSAGHQACEIVAAYATKQDPVILDIPCGHGRVMRHLRAQFPHSEIYGSDIDRDGVDFCAKSFGAHRLYSNTSFKMKPPTKFDIIWVGSLVTHLKKEKTKQFLKWAINQLAPGGVLILTSHGAFTLHQLETRTYGLTEPAQQKVLKKAKTGNYAYANYPNQKGYGISVIPKHWYEKYCTANGQVELLTYTEKGWDHHQDLVVLRKI